MITKEKVYSEFYPILACLCINRLEFAQEYDLANPAAFRGEAISFSKRDWRVARTCSSQNHQFVRVLFDLSIRCEDEIHLRYSVATVHL
jgi:hypothetical protein